MRLGRLIDRCAGHVNRSDNLLALRRSGISFFATGPYPKKCPDTVSLKNTMQQSQRRGPPAFRGPPPTRVAADRVS
jgi:hypothetical protein